MNDMVPTERSTVYRGFYRMTGNKSKRLSLSMTNAGHICAWQGNYGHADTGPTIIHHNFQYSVPVLPDVGFSRNQTLNSVCCPQYACNDNRHR